MPFEQMIYFILGLPNKSLFLELANYIEENDVNNQKEISKQAFSSIRLKIKSSAFKELFLLTSNISMKNVVEKWHNHQILAIDGTTFQLPDTEENRQYFGMQKITVSRWLWLKQRHYTTF